MKDIKANFYTATDEDGTIPLVPINHTPKDITITVTEDLERNITTLLLRQNKIVYKLNYVIDLLSNFQALKRNEFTLEERDGFGKLKYALLEMVELTENITVSLVNRTITNNSEESIVALHSIKRAYMSYHSNIDVFLNKIFNSLSIIYRYRELDEEEIGYVKNLQNYIKIILNHIQDAHKIFVALRFDDPVAEKMYQDISYDVSILDENKNFKHILENICLLTIVIENFFNFEPLSIQTAQCVRDVLLEDLRDELYLG